MSNPVREWKMIRTLVIAIALVAAPAAARDRHVHAVVPTLGERIDAIAPGTAITTTVADWTGSMGRTSLDVAFGPADASSDVRAVWFADGEGRDSSMRRAGIGRIVVQRTGDVVTVVADHPSVALASR